MINKVICNRYKVIDHLGTGGMATVWLAEDTILDRKVAIKTFKITTNDEEAIKRFNREANAVTSLSHPNIVSIYGVEQEDEYYYLILEYVEGITLKSYMQKNSKLPLEIIIHIMKQLTLAINHAHQSGIIHRDIKPQNVLVDAELNCKVTDFGISRSYGDTTLTQTNQMLGTVHYLSPEQARGNLATTQSDIYSLGTMLFELLTGEVPFKGESAVAIALKHLQEKFPEINNYRADIPQSVKNIVLKATMKNPNERYLNAAEMFEDLESCLDVNRLNEAVYTGFSKIEDDEYYTVNNRIGSEYYDYDSEEYYEDSFKQEEKKSSYLKKLLISLVVLFALGTSLVYAYTYFISNDNKVEEDVIAKVTVPELKNLTLEEAKEKLLKSNLKVGEIIEVSSDEIPENTVINSTPEAGSNIEKDSLVNLRISSGRESITMENLVGEDEERVRAKLNNLDFKNITYEQDYSDKYTEGKVMYQSIVAGTDVIPSKNTLVIRISKGAEKINVPELIGRTLQEVNQLANNSDFKIEFTSEYSQTVEENRVIKQLPSVNTEIKKGDIVKVVISKGVEKKEKVEDTKETIEIPNFVNKNIKDVMTWAEANEINIALQEQKIEGKVNGTVVSQSPNRGNIKHNSTITIVVVKN